MQNGHYLKKYWKIIIYKELFNCSVVLFSKVLPSTKQTHFVHDCLPKDASPCVSSRCRLQICPDGCNFCQLGFWMFFCITSHYSIAFLPPNCSLPVSERTMTTEWWKLLIGLRWSFVYSWRTVSEVINYNGLFDKCLVVRFVGRHRWQDFPHNCGYHPETSALKLLKFQIKKPIHKNVHLVAR